MSTLLKYTFGVFGEARLGPDVQLLHKTSPSGGSLHPIEAFPLVIDVDGLEPGYYHYDIRDHGLVPLVTMATKEDARQVAREISTQQLYVGDAPLVVVMVARFSRNQWKYRHQSRTYSVMMMDAGHLSQTFYLTATDLGLGAFYSGAIDSVKIEDALDLEPAELGAIGICGCGFSVDPEGESSDGGLPFVPVS